MVKRSKTPGTIVLSLKLVLRLIAVICIVLTGITFFFSTLSFKTVGIILAVGVVCLIYAEFTDD